MSTPFSMSGALSIHKSLSLTPNNLCQDFASKKNPTFSTNADPGKSKTKCLVFSKKPRDRAGILPVQLDNSALPWVSQVNHLGNLLQVDNTMNKRGKFIGKVTSILQEFHYVDPEILTKIMNIFTTSFYGSNSSDNRGY